MFEHGIERGVIHLPKHLVDGTGIKRDHCRVLIYVQGEDDDKFTQLQCDEGRNVTIDGCRANYQLGQLNILGCPLRNGVKQSSDFTEKIGIELQE